MADRTVTDSAGRTWTCARQTENAGGAAAVGTSAQGRDVVLSCATESVAEPVRITVGWQWESIAAPGLARLIMQASPAPRR
ncbi:MAG TPA: hypothetical protein VFJ74_05005 [Gemmatimonadaceae bacterium]|nr:hypothetical protein [Gemmatimonadaceae bacterium]